MLRRNKGYSSAVKHFLTELTVNKVFDLFSPEKISFLILKGPHLAYTVYDDPSQRDFCDLDILVKPGEFNRACAILVHGGFNPAVMIHERLQTQKAFYNYGFASPFGVIVELHRDLAGYRRYPVVIDDLFDRSVAFTMGESQVKGLAPEDLLCHLVIHIAKSYFKAIEPKHIRDIALVVQNLDVDWMTFIDRIRQANCSYGAYYALQAAHLQEGAEIPASVWEALTVPSLRKRWLERYLDPSTFPIYRYPAHSTFKVQSRLALPLLDRPSSWLPVLGRYAGVRFLDLILSLLPRKKLQMTHLPESTEDSEKSTRVS